MNPMGEKKYRLLAMDMDGTVLTGEKTISPRTRRAIEQALTEGKELLFATGRCPSEMGEYMRAFPKMKYALCLSGALIFDLSTGKALSEITISRQLAQQILDASAELDAMVNFYAGADVFVEKRRRNNLDYFNCGCFHGLYESCAVWVDDIREVLRDRGDRIYKINLYCHDEANWNRARELLQDMPFLNYASGIPNNYEISPLGATKGDGLKRLSEVTGIPLSEMIAVGDEGNDLSMLHTAGLGVAMGNAIDEVKAAADVVTGDCDHDGVAQVIEKYLLDR